jgi:predicted site-specific integrase-resolvase
MARTRSTQKITTYAAAKLLDRSAQTVRRYIASGKLRAERAQTGRFYVRLSDVESLKERGRRQRADERRKARTRAAKEEQVVA